MKTQPESDFSGIEPCSFHSWKLVAKHGDMAPVDVTSKRFVIDSGIARRVWRCAVCGYWKEAPISRQHEQTNSKYPRVKPGPMPDQVSLIDDDIQPAEDDPARMDG